MGIIKLNYFMLSQENNILNIAYLTEKATVQLIRYLLDIRVLKSLYTFKSQKPSLEALEVIIITS